MADLFVVRGCMSRIHWQLAASPASIDESGTDSVSSRMMTGALAPNPAGRP
jgi:hypothetical protein